MMARFVSVENGLGFVSINVEDVHAIWDVNEDTIRPMSRIEFRSGAAEIHVFGTRAEVQERFSRAGPSQTDGIEEPWAALARAEDHWRRKFAEMKSEYGAQLQGERNRADMQAVIEDGLRRDLNGTRAELAKAKAEAETQRGRAIVAEEKLAEAERKCRVLYWQASGDGSDLRPGDLREMESPEVYQMGWVAAVRGKAEAENPYPKGERSFAEWSMGYRDSLIYARDLGNKGEGQ